MKVVLLNSLKTWSNSYGRSVDERSTEKFGWRIQEKE